MIKIKPINAMQCSEVLITESYPSKNWIDCASLQKSQTRTNKIKNFVAHLPALADPDEYLEVHVDQADEGEDPGGEGGVPDEGQGVPENEVGVAPGLARVNLIRPVILCQSDLHELGSVEREGEDSDGDDVDQEPLAVAHGLKMQ